MRRVAIALLVAVLAAAACGETRDTDGAGTGTSATAPPATVPSSVDGWTRVDLPAPVTDIDRGASAEVVSHLLVVGGDDSGAMLADLLGDEVSFPWETPGDMGQLDTLSTDGLRTTVAEHGDATAGSSASSWFFESLDIAPMDQPRDELGRAPFWLHPVNDAEEDVRAVGVIRSDDGLHVRAWLLWDRWELLDSGPPLFARDPVGGGHIVVGSTETTAVVAGAVYADANHAEPQVWTVAPDLGDTAPWERSPLEPEPDGITDLDHWALGWWVAGHRDGRPIVYDFDRGGGAPLEVPDVALDPERPTVLLSAVSAELVLVAIQAEHGPGVWYRDAGAWTEIALPDGALSDVQLAGDRIYAVVDEQLWWTETPPAIERRR